MCYFWLIYCVYMNPFYAVPMSFYAEKGKRINTHQPMRISIIRTVYIIDCVYVQLYKHIIAKFGGFDADKEKTYQHHISLKFRLDVDDNQHHIFIKLNVDEYFELIVNCTDHSAVHLSSACVCVNIGAS